MVTRHRLGLVGRRFSRPVAYPQWGVRSDVRLCASGNADAAPASAQPDYIKQQKERLQAFKQQESDAAEGKPQEGDDVLHKILTYSLSTLALSGLSWIGYIYWRKQNFDAAQQRFLEDKAREDGVIKVSSGLMYRVLRKGSGSQRPGPRTPCVCNYTGKLSDGKEIESASNGKVVIPKNLIRGLSEALQLMVEGDVFELYLPHQLGYGTTNKDSIPGGSALIFEVELVSLQSSQPPPAVV